MKKNLVRLLLAGLLVFGVVFFMGCKTEDDEGSEKSIKINGLSLYDGYEGEVYLVLPNVERPVAGGFGTVSGGTLEVELYEDEENRWTGSGTYYIGLTFFDDYDSYNYYESKNKISFSSEVTTVNFAGFDRVEHNADNGGDYNFPGNSITVTDIVGYDDNQCFVYVGLSTDDLSLAHGFEWVINGTLEVELYDENNIPWTESGDYFVELELSDGNVTTVYISTSPISFSNGQTEIVFNDFEIEP